MKNVVSGNTQRKRIPQRGTDGTRTRNLLLDRQALLPLSYCARNDSGSGVIQRPVKEGNVPLSFSRDRRIRTSVLLVPNQARCQLRHIPFCHFDPSGQGEGKLSPQADTRAGLHQGEFYDIPSRVSVTLTARAYHPVPPGGIEPPSPG